MAIFIILPKSASASGCNWHSFPWSWQVKIHYVSLSHFPGVFMGPISKDRESCSCSGFSGKRMKSVLLKFDCILYYNIHFSYLWLRENPFTFVSNQIRCLRNHHPCISIFGWSFWFRIPMGGKKNKYTLPLPIVLKFKVFNIYLWKGNTGFKKSNMFVHV